MSKTLRKRRRLLSSTAESHDGLMLELLGAWDPPVSWGTAQPGAALGSRGDLLGGNQKKKIASMKKVKLKLGYVNGFYVQRQGRGSGLAMFWRKEVNLEIKSYSKYHIDAVIIEEASSFKRRLMGFYGHPKTHQRKESWRFLNMLNSQFRLPWLCFGDFNEILS